MRLRFSLLFLLALGLLLRVNNLSGRSLWTDEFFTLFQSSGHGVDIENLLDGFSKKETPPLLESQDFRLFLKSDPSRHIKDVTRGLLDADTHPPLYFWIIYIWMRVFGDGLFALRFFSVLMGVFAVFLAYRIGRHLFNQRTAGFCALFTAISAFSVRYSQEARAYSLIMVIGLLSSLFMLRLEKQNKNSNALWFAVFSALGLYAHYFYAFTFVGQFIYFSIAHRKEGSKNRKFYLAVLSSLLFFSPWFVQVILKGYNFRNAEWVFGYPGLFDKIMNLFIGASRYILISEQSGIILGLFLSAGLSFFLYIAIYGVKEMAVKYRRQLWFCLSILAVPLLAMFFLDIIQHGALLRQERFWMFSFLGFIPLAGYFLSFGFSKNRAVTSLLILLMLLSSFLVSKAQFGPAPEYTSCWINKESKGKASAVIVYNIRSAVFAQSYYLDNGIYLLPVSDIKQLNNTVRMVSGLTDKIFIVRHFHRTDASLMNQLFMEVKDIGARFKLRATINKDDISVSEFTKCAL